MNKAIISQLLLILLVSCSSSIDERMPLLQRADSLIRVSCPDSALYLLETIAFQDLKTPASQAEYALLLTQTKDKSYIPHTDDSLIRIAVDYYDSIDNDFLRAKSHYYWGRVYQDMGDARNTVREFLTALRLAEKVKDHDLICLSLGNLGFIFYEHGLLEIADSLYQQAEQLSELHHDSLRLAIALSKRGDICIEGGIDNFTKAEEYQKKAIVLAETIGNVHIERKVVNSLSSLYLYMKRWPESLLFARRGISLQPDSTRHYGSYSIIGNVYREMNQGDSAAYYFEKSLCNGNYFTKEDAYLNLSRIAREQGNVKKALMFDDYYAIYRDSSTLLQCPVELISSLTDILHQQSVQKHKSLLYCYRYFLFVLGVMLVFVVASFIFKRRQGKKKVDSLLENQQTLDRKIRLSEDALAKNEYEIKKWQQYSIESKGDLQSQIQINQCLHELLEQKQVVCSDLENQLEQQNTVINQLRMVSFKDLIKVSPCYRALVALRKENKENPDDMRKMTCVEWQNLVEEIDRVAFDFTKRLSGKYECILKDDIHFCCLVKLGFKYTDIALLLACTIDSVYKKSHAVLDRMQLVGSITQLKDLLEEF